MAEWDDAPLATAAAPAPQAPSTAESGVNPWDAAPAVGPTARQKAVISANDNGEEAARAVGIAKRTGIPASVVQSDLPGYSEHDRQQSAIKAVENPFIAKYVDSNPMAARVSGDDYDKLDEASQVLQALHPELVRGRAQVGMFQGIPEIANMMTSAPGREKLYAAAKALPAAIGQGILDFIETPGKVMAGETNLTTGEGLDKAIGFGIGVALGGGRVSAGRATGLEGIKGTPENAFLAGNEAAIKIRPLQTFDDFMHTLEGMRTRKDIDDFLASKQPGPPGAALQIEHAKAGSAALDAAVEVSQNSKTKIRSPELYADMVEAHDPGSVHIDANKIMELYQAAGKVPAEGDGLFGFVPDLAHKVQAAAATGGEVTIPISQYVAHVDPTVHEGLKGSVRLHNDGVTLEEAKEAEKTIEAYHGTPHDFERFDLTKIGTGEGAQVYGHGLYFAENRAVADQYHRTLTEEINRVSPQAYADPELGPRIKEAETDYDKQVSDLADALNAGKDQSVISEIQQKLSGAHRYLDAVSAEANEKFPLGGVYKVSIAADPTHFLDWDKPLKDQDPAILKKLAEASTKVLGGDVESQLRSLSEFTGEGGQFYLDLAREMESVIIEEQKTAESPMPKISQAQERVSKLFAEAGIPGIKYLDQGSRGIIEKPFAVEHVSGDVEKRSTFRTAEEADRHLRGMLRAYPEEAGNYSIKNLEGTRNFVVFDENLVKIKEKNDNPVEALVEAAVEAQKQLLYLNQLFKDAKSVGITDAEFKKYSDKVQRAEQAILDKAVAVNRREAASRLTPEWKRNEATIRDEVTEELKTQGPFAAEKYLRDNKIDIAHERAAQVADDLAPLFGFESGQDLFRGLESIEIEKAASGKGPEVQRRDAIAAETAARMEARYGNLAENIATEARETALADHTFDILADEVRILADAAGVAPPLSRAEMVAWAKDTFEGTNIRDAANWDKLRRAVEKGGREAEKALLKGDFLEAFQAKQRQMLAATLAKESVALQKVIDSAEKKIDRFSSEEIIKGLDQAHLEQIRQVLASLGLPQQFAPLADTPALRDFVTSSEGQIAVAPWLMDGSQPKLQDMSVGQFRDFVKSMQSLEHVGRQVNKLFSAMKEADLQNVVFDIKKSLERFPFIDQPNLPSIPQRIGSAARKVIGIHLLVERMLDYTDKFDTHGPLTEWLDRPLRDANTKELVLTEQVVRMLKDLRQHVDGSINDPIENKLIPDAMDKTGFLQMTRGNLRTLMLNMGNWSNIKKAVEGFGVNEADLRRLIDTNATAKDVAWVNGIWKVFDHLKPEADAVQLRDTGVPVDAIPAVGWDIAAGKLNGGYYPLSYDPYNSDIQGHIAQPLFDKGYFAATTPHGYTQARTEYKGALDLTGAFLSSKIQGMVHDIAFREAVRNADKLIKNQEFRTALAQRWGKESADLLPGWIRDIANSHNLDDNYAKGFQRFSALIRQNVVSTLIAYNPGTFIKHGFTAAVMSADRVGLNNLFSATRDIGFTGAVKNLSNLLHRADRVPDQAFMDAFRDLLDQGERGENARQFVLDSSAVMRNRQRQYEDSIRGAVDKITNIGWTQSFADFRQRQMQYGRLAVAFSDQMSAMPTWLAAYKKAYLSGESHADAVFAADKDMSRAHGSSFIGDKPLVSRVSNSPTGEFMRWFTGLYNFFNHAANNNFQLVWDASAALGGNKGGEPGANALSISRRVALVMGIIAIEEMAGPAKDEDGHGILTRSLLAGLRFFGAGFIGVREITNGLAHGYEPSTGMIGTLFKAGSDTVKDIGRASGVKAGIAKDWITHTATAIGFITGVGGSQLGRTGQFGADVATGRDRPQTFNDYRQGLRTGHSKARKHR